MAEDPTRKDLKVDLVGAVSAVPAGAQTQASFNVVNKSGLDFVVRVKAKPATDIGPTDKPAGEDWVSVVGDDRFMITDNGQHEFKFQVDTTKAPKPATDQKYYFKVSAVSNENPDAHWGESDPVPFVLKGKKAPPWALIGAIAAVVLIGIGIGLYFALRSSGVQVPDVVGKSVADATKLLTEKQFVVKSPSTSQPSTQPVDTVIGITPRPDKDGKLSAKTEITLTVATAEVAELLDVPPVANMTVDAATTLLKSKKFDVDPMAVGQPDSRPAGTVIGSKPDSSGGKQKAGTEVQLIIASANLVTLKSYIGQDYGAAMADMAGAGLKPTVTVRTPSPKPMGTVLTQSPQGGQVSAGSAVTLSIAIPVAKQTIPGDIIGKPHAAAYDELSPRGFVIRSMVRYDMTKSAYTVVACSQPLNVPLDPGTIVILYYSMPSPVIRPDMSKLYNNRISAISARIVR